MARLRSRRMTLLLVMAAAHGCAGSLWGVRMHAQSRTAAPPPRSRAPLWVVRGGAVVDNGTRAEATVDAPAAGVDGADSHMGTAAASPASGQMHCEGGVCYVKPPGATTVGATVQAGEYTNEPHRDYFSSQVDELASKGHSREEAEKALKEAQYDVGKAESLLGTVKQGTQESVTVEAHANVHVHSERVTVVEEHVHHHHHEHGDESCSGHHEHDHHHHHDEQQPQEAQTLASAATPTAGGVTAVTERAEAEVEKKLEEKEEAVEVPAELADAVKALKEKGLDTKSSLELLEMSKGNLQAALDMLEEDQLARDLDAAVEDMVKDGWDEEVARNALLAQREKMSGGSIKAPAPAPARKAAPAPAKKQAAPPAPKPAKKEDVVFECEENDLQKIVMESPVPVLLDVYADWCGPCKQLGPALEEMAVRAGGLFRLVKVNSDKNRGVSDALQVQALPSVFALREGRLVDSFVGMLPQDQMQNFMMRLMMGTPRPAVDTTKDPHAKSNEELAVLGSKLAHLAGLAAFGARRKEKLELEVNKLIQDTFELAGDDEVATTAIRTVDAYLLNVIKNPYNATFRTVNTAKPAFFTRVEPFPPAVKILEKAGFREDPTGSTSGLVLRHRNMAPIIAAENVISTFLSRKRQGAAPSLHIHRTKSWRRKGDEPPPQERPAAAATAPTTTGDHGQHDGIASASSTKPVAPACKSITLRLPEGGSISAPLNGESTLQEAFDLLRERLEFAEGEVEAGALRLVSRVPTVRTFVEGGKEAEESLADLGLGGDIVLNVVVQSKPAAPKGKMVKSTSAAAKPKPSQGRKKVHTLFSEGHYHEEESKGNRYYGGGSTYFEAAVDEVDGQVQEEVVEEKREEMVVVEERRDESSGGDAQADEGASEGTEEEDVGDQGEEDEGEVVSQVGDVEGGEAEAGNSGEAISREQVKLDVEEEEDDEEDDVLEEDGFDDDDDDDEDGEIEDDEDDMDDGEEGDDDDEDDDDDNLDDEDDEDDE